MESLITAVKSHEESFGIFNSRSAKNKVDEVLACGVQIDEYGLVVPNMNRQIRLKFSANLLDTKRIIDDKIRAGKHILYFPGSYDLVHAGHASFIKESIEKYCAQNQLTTEDLFVVALADEDELISTVKKNSAKDGELPRPIQSMGSCGHLSGKISPRLMDLATLPFVNLVGALPSPISFQDYVGNSVFAAWLDLEKGRVQELNGGSSDYLNLISKLTPENYDAIARSYLCIKNQINNPNATLPDWNISSWHLLLHMFLGDVEAGKFTRVISRHDIYANDVETSMATCGISAFLVNDIEVVSTTKLIEKFGWYNLANRKMQYLKNLFAEALIPFSLSQP